MKTESKKTAAQAEKVLILRTCDENMQSHNGFQWPESGPVEAPDWESTPECGNGLHGWLWGAGDWSLKNKDTVWWVVFEADAGLVIEIDDKVKVPCCTVVYRSQKWNEAMEFIRGAAAYPQTESSATGRSGHASATGCYGHASATGDFAHASATGCYGVAVAGMQGFAKADAQGLVAALWFDEAADRPRMSVGYVGENGIKADTWYRANEKGNLVEV